MPTTLTSDRNVSLLRRWVLLSFVYFIIAGCMGAFLRLQLFHPVASINYKYFLHGHSHLAFLGWVFNALFVALLYAYLPTQVKRYQLLFSLLQVSVVGMLISFPLQGYATISITFSTLHIFLSYAFAYRFLRDVRREAFVQEKHTLSIAFVKWSLFFMVLSSVGPFALGAIMAKGLAGTSLYQLAIYFYLHFQYDGWFSFAVFGLFFWIFETHQIPISPKAGQYFLLSMAISCMPAYALSTLWTHPPVWVYVVAALSALVQLIALFFLIRLLYISRMDLKKLFEKRVFHLLLFAGMAFTIKTFLQLFASFPAIADMAFLIRNFTIGYLHLIFLGFITVFLIGWFAAQKFLQLNNTLAIWGIRLLLVGFTGSELYIFLQPLFFTSGWGAIPLYDPVLFIFSVLMPIGTILLIWQSYRNSTCYQTDTESVRHSVNNL
ncbi:hypothetical protein GXP67_17665 [Rhodocytophaga rosea]|uniref:Cbb3-type cytochrome c oxidase subunit I n=1 Tax=Rhodocytophaga rosea TaxID=2704465 RepID=A0A6C0GJY2_9BACT|nr:hypothetical protein [Rhodocytophaga rosea]QHT68338.1 hypothetical protein GXP67_17665 [Rhodocytophaga rosea]